MSKPIYTPDFGIIAPQTLAPTVSKPANDAHSTADAFEGALSSAVTRQREAEARAQRSDRTKTQADSKARGDLANDATPKNAQADRVEADRAQPRRDAKAQPPKTARDDQSTTSDAQQKAASQTSTVQTVADAPKRTAPPKERRAADQDNGATQSADAVARDTTADAADASVDANAQAAVAKLNSDGGSDGQSADPEAQDQAASQDAAATDQILIAGAVAVPTVVTPPLADVSLSSPELASATLAATPSAGEAPAATPEPTAPAADASAAPVGDAAGQFAADLQAAAPTPAAPTPAPAAPAPAAPAPAPGQTAAPQSTPTQEQASQSAPAQSPSAQPSSPPAGLAAQSAEIQAAQQAVAQQTAPLAQATLAPLAKPVIPAESSSIASLKDAVDFSVSVTVAPSGQAAATPPLSGGSAGFNNQGGFGANGNPNPTTQGAAQSRPAAASSIVTQDLSLLSQTLAVEPQIDAPAEVAPVVAAASDDAAPVEVKPALTQSPASVQVLTNRPAFETTMTQQGAPSGRPHQVLLPLASQVSAGLVKLGQDGGGEITMRLQPANLGRIDVSMKIGDDGRMTAAITADRQDTLDLLRRDSYTLEQSLADAGLKTDGGGLQFSLRGESGQGDRDMGDGRGSRGGLAKLAVEPETTQANPTRRTSGLSRLDMRI